VGIELVDFVVDPEHRPRARHASNVPGRARRSNAIWRRLDGAPTFSAVRPASIDRVLVVRFSSLGDVVLTTPLLRALKRAHPACDITFATKAAYAPLFEHDPHVGRVVGLASGESVAAFSARLDPKGYDRCVDLHGSVRSLALRAWVRGTWTTYRKRRLARAALVHFGVRSESVTPVAERYFSAVRDLGVTPDGDRASVTWSAEADTTARAIAAPGCVVLAPGSAHATKRWPAAHWDALAGRLLAAGLTVVATGAKHERRSFTNSRVIDAFGAPLLVTAALMARARVTVANDSGLLHLATAAGCPVVGLYGPTVRAFGFHPYKARGTTLERSMPCRPCSAHGGASCPRGHHRCLADIVPEAVFAAVQAA